MATKRRKRVRVWPFILIILIVLAVILWLAILRAVRATNRDAWAFSVIDVVSAAAISFTDERGSPPERIDDLISGGYLVAGKRGESITLSTPFGGGCGGIQSLSKIRLHFPKSIEGWRLSGDSVVSQDGEETGLPYLEIVGEDYLPDGLAERGNRRFAREWFDVMRKNRPAE